MNDKDDREKKRTAKEAGWHLSRYNLSAPVPGRNTVAITNLFQGNCAEYSPIELYLLSVLDRLDEHHPIIERFAKRGIITRLDELAALEMTGRAACAAPHGVGLTRSGSGLRRPRSQSSCRRKISGRGRRGATAGCLSSRAACTTIAMKINLRGGSDDDEGCIV